MKKQIDKIVELIERYCKKKLVFAEVMAELLIKKGKTSELKQLLKNIELTKGAVKYHGSRANIHIVKEQRKTDLKMGNGGQAPP